MITECAMDKRRAAERQNLVCLVLGILAFTVESVTNPWHKFTLKLQKYFLT